MRSVGSPRTAVESNLDRVGLALIDLGRIDDAIQVLSLLAELDSTHSRQHALLAFAYYCAGRDDLAKAGATRAIALDSTDTIARAVATALPPRGLPGGRNPRTVPEPSSVDSLHGGPTCCGRGR